jgi:tetratricopeptide (TPR) repeat protein
MIDESPGAAASTEHVEHALEHVEQSAEFRSSRRHRDLLRHLISNAMRDNQGALKETVLAVEFFGRSAATFDPRVDTIVRVEARRLRARLSSYYRASGRDSALRIDLPVGSYVPVIAPRLEGQRLKDATRHARDLTERGEHYLRQPLSRETLERALERFDLALRESPNYAAALVGLGRAWFNLAVGWHLSPAIASEHAGEALRRALALAPDNSVAHVLLGAIQHQFEHDWPQARRSFDRALALAPAMAFVHSSYGRHVSLQGGFEAAERALHRARELDPMYLNARNHMVNLRVAQRRFDDAQAELEALADLAPDSIGTSGMRGALAMYRGDAAGAVQHYEKVCRDLPDYAGGLVALACAHAMAGADAHADALHDQALARFGEAGISPYLRALFALRRGRVDAAFELLDRAVLERDPYAIQIPLEPGFDDLAGDPRWPALLQRLGYAPRRRRS